MDDKLTCTDCGEEMVYNVPRLGPDGGFIHMKTGNFLCQRGRINTLEEVAKFHFAFGAPDEPAPMVHNLKRNALRISLLREELGELEEALAANDAVGVLDALTDLQVVLDGAYLALGFSHLKDKAFAEVQRSNMSKLGLDGKPIFRADGKILKGPNYSPPDLAAIVEGWE